MQVGRPGPRWRTWRRSPLQRPGRAPSRIAGSSAFGPFYAGLRFVAVLAALRLLGGCSSCRGGQEGGGDAGGAVSVHTAQVQRRDVAETLEVSGTLEPPPGRDV